MEKILLFLGCLVVSLQVGLLYLYTKLSDRMDRAKLTTDETNQRAITSIAGDMNRLTRTIGILMGSAGPEQELADQLEKEGALGALSKQEKEILAHQRKADMWRTARSKKGGNP